MNKDLSILKDKYGEDFAKLCRQLFPTILEKEGLLPKLILSSFEPTHQLYKDILEETEPDEFKNYIYSLIDVENETVETKKTVRELLNEKGYDFYECKTEEDIQSFKKYYNKKEELCTFLGDRLKRCYVFWAVKQNVAEIKRENFQRPSREDEYGTSVISIQFTREGHTLSIKNRYNHTVNNPDATFQNNLDNIIPGLTNAFEKEYQLKINQNTRTGFHLDAYTKANDKKYYKINYEINNIYYCPNNIIIDNGEVIRFDKSRYILIDYFLIDLKEKKIIKYDKNMNDSFFNQVTKIEKIEIIKKEKNKQIIIHQQNEKEITIETDINGRIIDLKIPDLEEIGENFLHISTMIKSVDLPNAKKIGDNFCQSGRFIEKVNIPKVQEIGNNFMLGNRVMKEVTIPSTKKIGNNFQKENTLLEKIDATSIEEIGDNFLEFNFCLKTLNAPNLKKVGKNFLNNNEILEEINTNNMIEKEPGFLQYNKNFKPKQEKKTILQHLKSILLNAKKRKEKIDEEVSNNKQK